VQVMADVGHFSPIPAKALRKYISYSRRYVHPKLSEVTNVIVVNLSFNLLR
jgi:DNA replicative helicase MCM subunit Mcm2 (Cdc46/Mcm family)